MPQRCKRTDADTAGEMESKTRTIGECRTASEDWFRRPAKRNFSRCREW